MFILKKIRQHYFGDIWAISSLALLFVFLSWIFVSYQGHVIVDCIGQGAYIPMQVLKGKVLYRDIIIPYGPFAYQLNAILFKFFGQSLNVLYTAGILISFIITVSIYFITRTLSTKWIAWLVSFMVMAFCIFNSYIFNYIFPYAPAMSYALSTFLLSVLFCILYFKSNNPKVIPVSFFFISLSMLNKVDFSPFLAVLLFIAVFLKPVPKKYLIYSLLASLILPVLSWGFLFYQGLTVTNVLDHIGYMQKFSKSPLFELFYSNYTGLYFDLGNFINVIINFAHFIFKFGLLIMVYYPILYLRFNKYNSETNFSKVVRTILFICVTLLTILSFLNITVNVDTFNWMAMTTTVFLFVVLLSNLIIKDKNQYKLSVSKLKEISLRDKLFVLIAIAGIIGALRSYFYINLQVFGTFFLPLVLIVNIVFLVEYLPDYFKKLDKRAWKIACSIILVSSSIFFLARSGIIARDKNFYPVKTDRGVIHTTYALGKPLGQAIAYINNQVPKSSSILMIPQGLILNFMTDRDSNNYYYDLLPISLDVFGEDKIVKDLRKNPPDYIFINNRDMSDWGFKYFGVDYGFKIYDFVTQNYTLKKNFGNKKFNIRIYKKAYDN